MDKYRIDSHKLIYHVPRLHDWLDGKTIYPIYMEISPAGACNHRCTYCGLDFMEYQPRFLDTCLLKERLEELGKLGLKSIMYAGEGEPFLHRDIASIISHTKKSGIDVSITTNGVFFNEDLAESIFCDTEWIKVSLDAVTPETYSKIHSCNPNDFNRVIENIKNAVKVKRKNIYSCTLGIQFLLLPENRHETVSLVKLARDIGMDYVVIKPYSQHTQSKTKLYSTIKYSDYDYLKDELQIYNTKDFTVIFRVHTMKKWDEKERYYERCLALPFWSYIDAGGNVWGCSVYLGDNQFFYGNIYEKSFQEIWEGERRKQSLRWVENELDTSNCRVNCRMDEINRYLWELKNTPEHVNFI